MSRPTIAIAHDYLTQRGGAERVVLSLSKIFPDAPIYTTLYDSETTYAEFLDRDVRPGSLNAFGPLRHDHRTALPFLASAVRHYPIIDADVLICSSSGWAHGYRTTGRKLVYCYSPARWLYQSEAYLGGRRSSPQALSLAALRPGLRRWDLRQARTADTYLAISRVVQQRVKDTYGITCDVLPAPHQADPLAPVAPPAGFPLSNEYFLCIARLLSYKNVDKVIEAFRTRPETLVVVGNGPEEAALQRLAGPNVVFAKNLTDENIRWLYKHCIANVSASYEDFGLTPLEAAAFGRPSVVLEWGGFLDTIVPGETGIFFDSPTSGVISAAIELARKTNWQPARLRAQADAFSEAKFSARMADEVDRLLALG